MKVTLVIVALLPFISGIDAAYRRVCYYTNWSQYRDLPAKFFPENVDPHLCTHIIYAFANLRNNELQAHEWNDETTDWAKGMYERFTDLKTRNPALKTLLAVGGWNMGSARFTEMVYSPSTRHHFVTTTIEFLRKRNFDGLDLDWEYPGSRGSPPEDKQRYVSILQELEEGFTDEAARSGKPRLILSAVVTAGKSKIEAGYDIPGISRHVDMINLMTYDFHGPYEDHTGFNSPLYKRREETGDDVYLNLDWAAQHWASGGASKEKLNIGLTTYGRAFTMADPSAILPGHSKSSTGHPGPYTKEAGFLAYYEICKMLESGATRYWHNEQMVPYLVHGNQWVGYDDAQSLHIKVDYIKKNNFGGVMIWGLPLDDHHGMCHGGAHYPLITAINHALRATSTFPPITRDAAATTRSPTHHVTNAPSITTETVTGSHPHAGSTSFCSDKADGIHADPNNCLFFYECAGRLTSHQQCASGTAYDTHIQTCNIIELVHTC